MVESNASPGKNTTLFTKIRKHHYCHRCPAHGLSGGKEFNIPTYAEFIHVLFQKFKPKYLIGHSLGAKHVLYYQSVYQNKISKIVIRLQVILI
jgi:pimeloyl-ACP methyl ester carboxylesterase